MRVDEDGNRHQVGSKSLMRSSGRERSSARGVPRRSPYRIGRYGVRGPRQATGRPFRVTTIFSPASARAIRAAKLALARATETYALMLDPERIMTISGHPNRIDRARQCEGWRATGCSARSSQAPILRQLSGADKIPDPLPTVGIKEMYALGADCETANAAWPRLYGAGDARGDRRAAIAQVGIGRSHRMPPLQFQGLRRSRRRGQSSRDSGADDHSFHAGPPGDRFAVRRCSKEERIAKLRQ